MNFLTPAQKIKDFEHKRKVISGLLLLIFCGLAVIINNIHLSRVADDNTKLLSRLFTTGDQREVTHILYQAHLTNFNVIRYESTNPEKSFVIPPIADAIKDRNPFASLLKDKVTIPISNGIDKSSADSITFEFNRFRLVPHAAGLWLLLLLASVPQLAFMKKRLKEKYFQEMELEKKAAKSELAHEIRHNLRTPLAALMRIPSRLPEVSSTEKELLKNTIYQIQELISKLDDNKNNVLAGENSSIYDTLYQAKNEIALTVPQQFNFTFKIDDSLISSSVNHIPFELRAIISNIVNNAVEAMPYSGKIIVKATDKIDSIEITVSDNGAGIDLDILPKVFEKHFSHNKPTGTGVGLSHAKEFIESWSGAINITSSVGFGTSIKINLPIQSRKSWHLSRLKVEPSADIFVLDDQQLNINLWKLKFSEHGIKNQVHYLQNATDLHQKLRNTDLALQTPIFLFDYDLKDSISGLDLLNAIPNTAVKCLVTGHFDNKDIQDLCDKSNVYLLPKSQISELPIVILEQQS